MKLDMQPLNKRVFTTKGLKAVLVIIFTLSFGLADIIITEIADSNDDAGVRYIEIHNSGGSSVALSDYYFNGCFKQVFIILMEIK